MPRLSIVIPWTGPAGPFEDTLAAVLQNRPSGCEVLVALSQPYDDPYQLASEVTFLPAEGKSDAVSLINRGIEAASSSVVEVITCGLIVSEGWTSAALLHFDDSTVAAVAPVLVSEANATRVLAAGVNFTPGGARQFAQAGRRHDVAELVKTKPHAAPFAGGFFRKSVVEALGGFDAALGVHAADLDFAMCAVELGLRIECEPTSVISSGKLAADNGSLSAGKTLEQLFWRHLSPAERREVTPAHYLRIVNETAFGLVQPWWLAHSVGRALGWLASSLDRGHAARIAQAKEQLETSAAILSFPRKAASPSGAAFNRRAA